MMSNLFYTTHSVACNDGNSPATDRSHLLSAAAVSNQRKAVLSTYISEAKAFLEPRVAVTNDELDSFLELVFTDWTTEEPCYPPNKKDADAAFGDKHVRVGTLSRDLPTTEATNASRLRAEKHRVCKKDIRGSQTKYERKAGAPVYIRASQVGTKSINYYYVDGKGQVISMGQGDYILFEIDQVKRQHYLALRRIDSYHINKSTNSISTLAIYLARNRLRSWSLGDTTLTAPDGKEAGLEFIPFRLCRHMDNDCAPPSRTDICNLPAPSLF